MHINSELSIPETEIHFQFTRSGGPGGQHVNKVSTQVELLFDVINSPSLDASRKRRIIAALGSRIGSDGILRVAARESRSQWRNRENAKEKFIELLRRALVLRKKRVATRPSGRANERRVSAKKLHGRKKKMRGIVRKDD
jgi:ribosome-associated protein